MEDRCPARVGVAVSWFNIVVGIVHPADFSAVNALMTMHGVTSVYAQVLRKASFDWHIPAPVGVLSCGFSVEIPQPQVAVGTSNPYFTRAAFIHSHAHLGW